jgi:3-oxoacyl-[acyl-carrier protein] reductase
MSGGHVLDRDAVLLEGKVAIVTGGGGGIGRAISETFAAHGARVVVAERDEGRANETVAAIESRGGAALAQIVDVQEREPVEAMTAKTMEEYGRVDILVNNVGDFCGVAGSFLQSTEEQWDTLYRENLHHLFLCTRAVVPHMIERGEGGSVINLTSVEAFRGLPMCPIYGTFKHAVTGFTRSTAVEFGPYGVRVNAIAPETTDTIQVNTSWMIGDRPDLVPYWVPLGRFGVPDDSAGAALFLASDLSAWTTGSTVHVDGGVLAAAGFYRVPGTQFWSNTPRMETPAS